MAPFQCAVAGWCCDEVAGGQAEAVDCPALGLTCPPLDECQRVTSDDGRSGLAQRTRFREAGGTIPSVPFCKKSQPQLSVTVDSARQQASRHGWVVKAGFASHQHIALGAQGEKGSRRVQALPGGASQHACGGNGHSEQLRQAVILPAVLQQPLLHLRSCPAQCGQRSQVHVHRDCVGTRSKRAMEAAHMGSKDAPSAGRDSRARHCSQAGWQQHTYGIQPLVHIVQGLQGQMSTECFRTADAFGQ